MGCTCPIDVWPAPPGAPDRRPVFSAMRSYEGARSFRIPCGQCIGCRRDRAGGWALRCLHEAKVAEAKVSAERPDWVGPVNHFATLTYSDDKLPKDWSLSVREAQLFLKRVRSRLGPFRYLFVGEYSPAPVLRPHYHALLFGLELRDLVPWSKAKSGGVLSRSAVLEECWPFGFVLCGPVTLEAARYTAGYCVKKLGAAREVEACRRVDPETGAVWSVAPEFATMSRRPGLGSEWFDRFAGDAFPSDFLVAEGRKYAVPRFYLDRLDPAAAEAVKQRRRMRGIGRLEVEAVDRRPAFPELRRVVKALRRDPAWFRLDREEKRIVVARRVRAVVARRVGRNALRAAVETSDRRLLVKHEIARLKQARIHRDGADV